MNSAVSRQSILFLVFLAALFAGGPVSAQFGTPTSIPDSLKGAYRLVMTDAIPSSPISNNSFIDFTIGNSNTLCTIGLALGNPVVRELSTYWDSDVLGISFRLIVNEEGATPSFAGLEFFSSSGTYYGRLLVLGTGDAISPCGAVPPANSRANELFEALEAEHSDLFPANPFSPNRSGEGYDVYRFYQSTGIYLAILDDLVYARGGDFGEQFLIVGILDELIDAPEDLERPYFADYAGHSGLPGFGGFNTDDLEFIQGTYRMSMTNTLSYSPIPDGTEMIFVITPQGQMCVGETVLGFPKVILVYDDEDVLTASASWRNLYGNLSYDIYLNRNDTLELTSTNMTLGAANVRTAFGNPYFGRFEGVKISIASECIDASGGNPDLPEINAMFDLIEAQYPELFPSGPQTYNQYNDGFVYRFYYNSNITVGVKSGVVYASGGQFGNSVVPNIVGTLAWVLDQLRNPPSSAATRGYDLQVTGTKETTTSNFPAISSNFEDRKYAIARPDSTDTSALTALVREILEDEVQQINFLSTTVLVDTVSTLSFRASVTSTRTVAGQTTTRRYSLVFNIERRQ